MPSVGRDTGRAPLREGVLVDDVVLLPRLDDDRARDAGADPEPGEHLVDRVVPVGGQQQPLGGEGDGLQHGVAAQRRRQ